MLNTIILTYDIKFYTHVYEKKKIECKNYENEKY